MIDEIENSSKVVGRDEIDALSTVVSPSPSRRTNTQAALKQFYGGNAPVEKKKPKEDSLLTQFSAQMEKKKNAPAPKREYEYKFQSGGNVWGVDADSGERVQLNKRTSLMSEGMAQRAAQIMSTPGGALGAGIGAFISPLSRAMGTIAGGGRVTPVEAAEIAMTIAGPPQAKEAIGATEGAMGGLRLAAMKVGAKSKIAGKALDVIPSVYQKVAKPLGRTEEDVVVRRTGGKYATQKGQQPQGGVGEHQNRDVGGKNTTTSGRDRFGNSTTVGDEIIPEAGVAKAAPKTEAKVAAGAGKVGPGNAEAPKRRYEILGSQGKVISETESDAMVSSAIAKGYKVRPVEPASAPAAQLGADSAASVQPIQSRAAQPPPTPRAVDEATGLANQVQMREAEAKILSDVEPTRGKSPEEWQRIGKKAFDDGRPESDYEGLAERVASKDVELTGERVGILLEGKRQLVNRVNFERAQLELTPGDEAAINAYRQARARLDDYVTKVQAGKGRWSDVGRALQAGTELDTGNFAEVLAEGRRVGSRSSETQIRSLTSQVAERDARIAALEQKNADILADRAMQRLSRERRTAQKLGDIQSRRQDAINRLKKTAGQVQAGIDPAQARAFYDWAKTYAEEGVTRLDDLATKAGEELGWKRDDVIQHLAARMSEYRTASDLQKQMRELKGQAGTEARIAELKRQLETGEFEKPDLKKRAVDAQIANLRAERDYWSSRVREAVKPPEKRGAALARGASSAVRGVVLGQDIGTLMRQGLFSWGRLAVGDTAAPKAALKGAKALFSEPAMLRMEKAALEAKAPDGRLYAAVERKSGLSISDRITAPEESAVGRVLSNLPVVGKAFGSLDRGQHMFINDVRRTMFRHGVDQGWSPEELQQWAKFINNATGRGNIRSVHPAMEVIMTSPRYEASRWAMLGHLAKSPLTAVQALKNPAAREEIKTLGATAASIYLVFKGAEMAGYDVTWDPKSSDFLKMRRGDEVWDISAGIAPRLRDSLRIIGAIVKVGDEKERDKIVKLIGSDVSRTVSPAIKTPTETLHSYVQRNEGVPEDKIKSFFTGYPLDEYDKGMWAWSPLIYRSFHQALTQEKSVGAAVGAGAKEFIGTSVNRYPKHETEAPKSQKTRTSSTSRRTTRRTLR